MPLYLTLDLFAVLVPFIFSFHPKLQFIKQWKFFFPAALITALVFTLWDAYFTRIGVWGFNSDYLVKVYFLGLPLEEYLFFICVPYSCTFSYYAFKKLKPGFTLNENFKKFVFLGFAALLLIVGAANYEKLYSCSAFVVTSLSLLLCYFRFNDIADHFILTFSIMLIPFFIMNGILTGSFIENEIVWYNNNHNMGFRIATIPVEDIFYGMSLILWNIKLTELFSKRLQGAL